MDDSDDPACDHRLKGALTDDEEEDAGRAAAAWALADADEDEDAAWAVLVAAAWAGDEGARHGAAWALICLAVRG